MKESKKSGRHGYNIDPDGDGNLIHVDASCRLSADDLAALTEYFRHWRKHMVQSKSTMREQQKPD